MAHRSAVFRFGAKRGMNTYLYAPKDDPYHLYLAYHEGPAGFQRKSFDAKPWLLGVARKVEQRAGLYQRQAAACRPAALASSPAP